MKFLLSAIAFILLLSAPSSSHATCVINCGKDQQTTKLLFKYNDRFDEHHLNLSSSVLGKDLGFGHRWETKTRRGLKEWNIQVVQAEAGVARLGTRMLRFETREGFCTKSHGNSGWDDCKNGRSRAEIKSLWKNEVKPNKPFWHSYSFRIPSTIEQKIGVKTSIWQIHSGSASPSWMIRFTKDSGLKIENHTVFPPDETVLIPRAHLFDQWHDVVINANLSKDTNGSFKLWVNGEIKFQFNGQTKQLAAKRDSIDLGVYNTGSRYSDINMNGKNLGNITVFFDELRVGDNCKDLQLADLGYACSALYW